MREITQYDIVMSDLKRLNSWKFAIVQLTSELETLEVEYASIKATNFDKMPTGTGENAQEEKLVSVIARKDELKAKLELNQRKVADLERLLDQLSDDERRIIDRMVISQEMYAVDSLAKELGFEARHIYNKRSAALRHLCQLRYGAAYQP